MGAGGGIVDGCRCHAPVWFRVSAFGTRMRIASRFSVSIAKVLLRRLDIPARNGEIDRYGMGK